MHAGNCYLSNPIANSVIGALVKRIYSYPLSAATTGTGYAFTYDECENLCLTSSNAQFSYFALTQDRTTSTGQTKYTCACYSKYTPGPGIGSCSSVTVGGTAYPYGNNGSEFVFKVTI
jgi:hypothetical protein